MKATLKLCGKRLYATESVQYLGVQNDANLSWQNYVNDISIKLNRTNALLFKMRKYVGLIRSIYFVVFDSYLSYCCFFWTQNRRIVFNNCDFTKKAVRIINFQLRSSHTSPLLKQNSILKFQDKISVENILFASKCLNNLIPSVFSTWFSFFLATPGNLTKLSYKTNRYRKYSISAVESSYKI